MRAVAAALANGGNAGFARPANLENSAGRHRAGDIDTIFAEWYFILKGRKISVVFILYAISGRAEYYTYLHSNSVFAKLKNALNFHLALQ
jgi:hypothetical protein